MLKLVRHLSKLSNNKINNFKKKCIYLDNPEFRQIEIDSWKKIKKIKKKNVKIK